MISGQCWLYDGYLNPDGYGWARADGKSQRTHRAVFEAFFGPIPDGLVLDHLCRNRACYNPSHLDPVSQGENTRRGLQGALRERRTHCPQGHEYTPENTREHRNKNNTTVQECRTCNRVRMRRQRAK